MPPDPPEAGGGAERALADAMISGSGQPSDAKSGSTPAKGTVSPLPSGLITSAWPALAASSVLAPLTETLPRKTAIVSPLALLVTSKIVDGVEGMTPTLPFRTATVLVIDRAQREPLIRSNDSPSLDARILVTLDGPTRTSPTPSKPTDASALRPVVNNSGDFKGSTYMRLCETPAALLTTTSPAICDTTGIDSIMAGLTSVGNSRAKAATRATQPRSGCLPPRGPLVRGAMV